MIYFPAAEAFKGAIWSSPAAHASSKNTAPFLTHYFAKFLHIKRINPDMILECKKKV